MKCALIHRCGSILNLMSERPNVAVAIISFVPAAGVAVVVVRVVFAIFHVVAVHVIAITVNIVDAMHILVVV